MLKSIIPILCAVFCLSSFSILHSFASEISLPSTGQTTSLAAGDDGAIQAGVPSPSLRFTAVNGAVTDNLTGLIWLQDANCFGLQSWTNALSSVNNLASGTCGLTDDSTPGQWRLPTRLELESLVDRSKYNPALPPNNTFSNVQLFYYWSSSTYGYYDTTWAWGVYMNDGTVDYGLSKASFNCYAWPVRGGQ